MPQIYHLGKLIGDANPGHEILNSSGTAMTQRNKLQINNATITDDPTNDKTIVTPSGGGGGGGSTIKVTTTETTLRGKNITLTGSTTLTATFDSNGVATFTGVTMTGTLTLYTSDGTSSATKAISVPYFGNYEESISFWAAIISVSASSSLNGKTVYAKLNGAVAASGVISNGSASLTVNSTGTYSVEVTVVDQMPDGDHSFTYKVDQIVSAQTTYPVTITAFNVTLNITTTSSDLYEEPIVITRNGSAYDVSEFSPSGTATYIIHETGTYTLTCTYGGEDYSESITIVSGDDGTTKSVTINMADVYDVTVTLYSAASDTVTWTDDRGVMQAVTAGLNDAGGLDPGVAVNVRIVKSVPPGDPAPSVTLTSSVAKDLPNNDTSTPYSKTVTLGSSLTEIRLMPDETIYWYGYGGDSVEGVAGYFNDSYSSKGIAPTLTLNTNTISAEIGHNTTEEGFILTKNALNNLSSKNVKVQKTDTPAESTTTYWKPGAANNTSGNKYTVNWNPLNVNMARVGLILHNGNGNTNPQTVITALWLE